jgi:hypothetical protein
MIDNRKNELQTIIDNARNELYKIEDNEKMESFNQLLGKCFRYRNCFSCPSSDKDYWYMYMKVTGISDSGELLILQFEKDGHGDFSIRPDYTNLLLDLSIEITEKEFNDAWKGFVTEIINLSATLN